jgi:hypothetical protein
LGEHRYEQAIELLRAAREHAPDAPEIQVGIRLVERHFVQKFERRVGGLDGVPEPTVDLDDGPERGAAREIFALVDGATSFAAIVASSRHGAFETVRILQHLLDDGLVRVERTPPRAPHRTGAVVSAALALVALVLLALFWQEVHHGASVLRSAIPSTK